MDITCELDSTPPSHLNGGGLALLRRGLTMHSITFMFALPLLVLAALIALVVALRSLLHSRSTRIPAGTALSSVSSADPWERITSDWNVWITGVLPTVIGCAVLVLTVWFFAYLGWAVLYMSKQSPALSVHPPGFGGPENCVVFAIVGLFAAFFCAAFAAFFLLVGHLVGRCVLWPEVCWSKDCDGAGDVGDAREKKGHE